MTTKQETEGQTPDTTDLNQPENTTTEETTVEPIQETAETEAQDATTEETSATEVEMVIETVEERINLRPGMTVRIYQKIKELNTKGEEKERVQYFEGMIIAKKHGNEAGASITVRKVSDGVGVEKVFPLFLPTITKIEVKKQARVRRAKLGYLRKGFKRRLKETRLELTETRE